MEENDYLAAVEEMRIRFNLCTAWPYCQYHGCTKCEKVVEIKRAQIIQFPKERRVTNE